MAIIITRTIIIYLALLVTMRVLGKRQLGELELSEFVVAALIAAPVLRAFPDLRPGRRRATADANATSPETTTIR